MAQKNIPFDFVLDELIPLEVAVKPMFGMWAVYLDEKIMLILRLRGDHPDANGVWVATGAQHHESLKSELPSLRSIPVYSAGIKETEWQLIPVVADEFEDSVRRVCELIKRGDNRIGRIPKKR